MTLIGKFDAIAALQRTVGTASRVHALLAVLLMMVPGIAHADDTPLRTTIAAHLRAPEMAEIELFKSKAMTDPEGRAVHVVCGMVTVRRDAGNFASSGFAYVIDDDRLWMSSKSEWLKAPNEREIFPGVMRVAQYCREY
jgi:hypothetical protein